ncbi:MAG: polymerase subunit alpha, polymerase subunit alpha protein [Candidatus Parcubacteria bacterium]|nr:polymerase subunit alpha, polymerase subunit alpha protein [Candidatus Parcubacteria bacterium]
MPSRFVHLHTHSHYSLLSALPRIDELVGQAKSLGMDALALTDNGNMYGAIEFYKACKKKGVKPIIGVDFYVAARTRTDMQPGIDSRRYRLVLLAQNEIGYKNLIQLVTRSHMEGFYYKPRIDRELMEQHTEGLVAIIPSFSGEIPVQLKGRGQEKAAEAAEFYKKTFGPTEGKPNRLYLEITHHPEIDGHEAAMKTLIDFGRAHDIPLVAAHDVYYIKPEDRFARETLMRVNSHTDASDRISDSDEDDFSFISPEKAEDLFRDTPDALDNTRVIADSCNLELALGSWVFPNYIVESGRSYDDELQHLVEEGYARRSIEKTPEVVKRAEYELDVIKKKGYAPYFLVVSDLLRFAHENKILTTIRGSVAGSLVTYLSGITNVNPIEYKLPFERFLNPERPSAPDIDMDYADNRRDEMIAYARKKYGADKVAQIGTFGTMMARGAVKDVSRAMGFGYDIGDRISKLIPMGAQGFPMTITRALEMVPELKTMYENEPDIRRIIDMALKIEGCARHISVHAAGVVIAPRPLTDFTPLQPDPKGEGKIITQFDMHAVEDAGLLKFDFLGIRNLAILADAVERVNKIENLNIDIENIPIDDPKTYEMLARGETIGLFQLNGTGMTRFLVELKPSTIHDINAMVALYRPGPMESIPQYIERKHDAAKVKYLDPRMKDILDQSYGVITYQDDVMMIAIKLAGYSWLDADKLRKAMGKKIPAEMAEQKGKLLEGFVKNGLAEKKADQLWKLIEPFAAYGFNKAHAASYGKVAYQTAYMKANFPEIYMSAVLTAESGDIEMIGEIVTECRRMDVPVLPPDVNESFSQFTVVKIPSEEGVPNKYRIRFGLVTIKNFGQGISTAIIDERKHGGPFKSLADFLDRVKDRNLNKKSLEALIKSGAMDCFGEDRGTLLANMDLLLEYNKEKGAQHSDQDSLFGLMGDSSSVPTLKLAEVPPADMGDKLAWEKELLGLYISGHPLERYREAIAKKDMNIKKAKESGAEGSAVVLAVIITAIRPVQTKKNETMLFITISDFTGSADAVVFPRTYQEFRSILVPDACIAVKANINTRNGEKGFVIERAKKL